MTLEQHDNITKPLVFNDGAGGHMKAVYSPPASPISVIPGLGVTPGNDAFGRLRSSDPTTLFDSTLEYDEHPLMWWESITDNSGSAATAHLANESSHQFTCGGNDTIIRQTKRYIRYQPGKSQLVMLTFVFGAATTGVTRRAGYFDGNNGIFLEQDGDGTRFVRRTFTSGAAVDNKVEQADWNLDTLDGSGGSTITVDLSKSQILVIDMEWLGTGSVRVGFIIDGSIRYAHSFNNANSLTTVYATTANLPVRYEMTVADGTAGTHTMKQICSMVASEGGFQQATGLPFAASTGLSTRTVTNADLPVISIRPRQTFNGKTVRGTILIEHVHMFNEDTTVRYQIIYGGTLGNTSWVDVDSDYSITQYDISGSTITGGIVVTEGYVEAARGATDVIESALLQTLPLVLDIDGNHPTSPLTDNISIVAQKLTGGANTDMAISIDWREER